MFRKLSPPHRSILLCSNFVKCCRWEIGKIVRYLLDKKTILAASQTVTAARIARDSPKNVFTDLQISSKSVHFQPSYGRMREHRFLPRKVNPLFAAKLRIASWRIIVLAMCDTRLINRVKICCINTHSADITTFATVARKQTSSS